MVPAGKFINGSLDLKNNVDLHLESDAVVLGSIDPADYRSNDPALIFALGQKNNSVTGRGTINGRGVKYFVNLL